MLYRELYRGVVVWNKSQKIVRGGTRAQRRRPVEEWLRLEAPELRIVPEDIWLRVHVRLDRARLALPRSLQGGRLIGRPSYLDGDSPYLLTGFAQCSVCGGAIGSIPRAHGTGSARQRVDYYGCFTNHRRGGAICANKPLAPRTARSAASRSRMNRWSRTHGSCHERSGGSGIAPKDMRASGSVNVHRSIQVVTWREGFLRFHASARTIPLGS